MVLAYRELKRDLGRRLTYLEFHFQGTADSKTIKQAFGSWFGLFAYVAELNTDEIEAWMKHQNWFLEVEKTGMNKSYKMVVLNYMLSKGMENWLEPITPVEVAPYFHEFLTAKQYRLNDDFNDLQGRKLRDYDEKKIANLIERIPMTKWSGSAKEDLVTFDDNLFSLNLSPSNEHQRVLYVWTNEIAEYRLHAYFERKAANRN